VLVLMWCVAILLSVVVTGRADYALARRAGIRRYGLEGYEVREEANDRRLAVALGLVFPLTWMFGLGYATWLLLEWAVTSRPYVSVVEQQELLRRQKRELVRERKVWAQDIERLERELGFYDR
jgi:hypothetical protein